MPHDQTYDEMQRAIASHDPVQEPWHTEPPSDGAEEIAKERDWAFLASEAKDFVKKYGASAMLRCISETLKE